MSAITALTASQTAAAAAAAQTKAAATSSIPSSNLTSLASEDTFLKLFVAQLQNQDPMNPDEQSGTQMVTQLAQFSQLEQMMNIGTDVHTIAQDVTTAIPSGNTPAASTSPDGSSQDPAASTGSTQSS
jgi:flagellar basal-body rod modification protein FlgD